MGLCQPSWIYDTTPNKTCQVCHRPCTNAYGERIMVPHKARSCTVCRAWYCGDHKVTHLKKRPDREENGAVATYKCRATCVGRPRTSRRNQS